MENDVDETNDSKKHIMFSYCWEQQHNVQHIYEIINNEFKYVEEFIINKNLMLMFDASPLMRLSFYKNFKKINMKNALNKDIFLII